MESIALSKGSKIDFKYSEVEKTLQKAGYHRICRLLKKVKNNLGYYDDEVFGIQVYGDDWYDYKAVVDCLKNFDDLIISLNTNRQQITIL